MTALRVLITNIQLSQRTGTETYLRDLALGLKRQGHDAMVYSPELGELARELQASGIQVVDDLERLAAVPDVIHGQHHPTTISALVAFPTAPALFFVHDRYSWHDEPPRHPRLLRYAAVDDFCRERLEQAGLPDEACVVVRNAVDLGRFAPRPVPLPSRPKKALIFSNYARSDNYAAQILEVCRRAGLQAETAGHEVGRLLQAPEEVLPGYDLVFGKGRCALEALAVGCAVVVCDRQGVAGMVTPDNYQRFRRRNFGQSLLDRPVHRRVLEEEIARYDAVSQGSIAEQVRKDADLETLVGDLVGVYRQIIREAAQAQPSAREESLAIVRYLNLVRRQLGHGHARWSGPPGRRARLKSWLGKQFDRF